VLADAAEAGLHLVHDAQAAGVPDVGERRVQIAAGVDDLAAQPCSGSTKNAAMPSTCRATDSSAPASVGSFATRVVGGAPRPPLPLNLYGLMAISELRLPW